MSFIVSNVGVLLKKVITFNHLLFASKLKLVSALRERESGMCKARASWKHAGWGKRAHLLKKYGGGVGRI